MLSWSNPHPSKIRCLLIKTRRTKFTLVNQFGEYFTIEQKKLYILERHIAYKNTLSVNDMSFNVSGQRMIHAAVNTDPLQQTMVAEAKQIHYGLKERNIPHVKINEMKELRVWYDFGEKIGEGGFGSVMLVKEKSTNKEWAMKTVTKQASGDRLKLAQQEIHVLKLIEHPHIIYLDKVFESSKFMYMVFEKCHDFASVYRERKPFPEKIAKKIISELVDAVAYLHKYDIVHRDLKIENILLGDNPADPNDEYYIKVTDFGLSIVKYGKGFESYLHDYCGTPQYMAPEIITCRSYTQMCDMWSVGVILYMLVLGEYPFSAKGEEELRKQICDDKPALSDPRISAELRDLLSLLLVKEPVNRIRATEVLRHPWILNKKLSKCMDYNILDKMKEWKSEMTVETGAATDWAMSSEEILEMNRNYNKQVLHLPKTNIHFDRSKRSLRRNSNREPSIPRFQKTSRESSIVPSARTKK